MPAYVVRRAGSRPSPVMEALRALEAKEGKAATKSQVARIEAQVQPAPAAPKKAKPAAKKKAKRK